jgi:hypothetical protein
MEIGNVIAVVVKTTNAKRHMGLVQILLPQRSRQWRPANIAIQAVNVHITTTAIININAV